MTEPTNLPNVIYSLEEREWPNEDVIVKLTPKDKLSGIKKLEYAWSETTDVPFNWIKIPLIKKPCAYGDFNSNADLITKNGTISPDPNAVYTLRPGEGKFGGCVAVEEGTTNIINPKPEAWSEVDGGKVEKIDLYKMRVTNSTGGQWGRVQSLSFTVGNGETVTISGYIEGYAGHASFRLRDITSNVSRISLVIDSVGYYHGTWTNNLGNDIKCQLWLTVYGEYNPAGQQYIIADKIQVEKKPYATSFVDGTRAAGRLSYPKSLIAGLNALTVAAWTPGPSYLAPVNKYLVAAQTTGTAHGDVFALRQTGDNNRINLWVQNDANSAVASLTYDNVWDGNWHLIVGVINKFPQPGRQPIELYVDGELVASDSNVNAVPDLSNIDETWGVQVGNWRGSLLWNGLIDELLILPYAATEEEIQDLYLDRYPSYKVSQSTKGQWYLHTRIENNSGDIVTDYRGPYKIDKPTFVETRLGTALNLGMSDLQIKLPYSVNEYSVYMCRREKEEEDFHSIVILSDGRVYVDGFINLSYDISWFNFTGDTLTIGSKAWEIMELLIVKEIVPDLKIHEWAQHPTFFHDPAEDYNIQTPTIVDMEVL